MGTVRGDSLWPNASRPCAEIPLFNPNPEWRSADRIVGGEVRHHGNRSDSESLAVEQAGGFFDARREFSGTTVQDGPRFMDVEKVTGHHVSTKKQIMLRAVKSTVAERMPRQMDHPQSAPERKFLQVGDEFVNCRRTIPEQKSPSRFQPTTPAIDARVRIITVDVSVLLSMGEHARASPLLQPREIPCVIEVAVSQENGFDGSWVQAKLLNKPFDQERFADHPRIYHHTRVTVFQQMATTHDAADGM